MAANTTAFASNSFGVNRQPIDYTQPGAPTVQSYHGGSIVVNNNVVGRIESWNPAGAYTRSGKHIMEVSHATWGLPVDYVPGVATGFNITFTRTEVWNQELEITLGYAAVWENLTDQTFPFVANEYLFQGVNLYRMWAYNGCWFTSKAPVEWTSEGEGIIKVSCDMAFVSRKKMV